MIRLDGFIAHHHVVITQHLNPGAPEGIAGHISPIRQREIPRNAARRLSIDRSRNFPLVLKFIRASGQIRRMLEGHHLAQRIFSWNNFELPLIELRAAHLKDMHGHRITGIRKGDPAIFQ